MKDLKKDFRKIARESLQQNAKDKLGDKQILRLLKKYIARFKPHRILVYLPMDMEVDIFPLIFYLKRQKNIRIFAPFILNDSFKIVPFRLPLAKNKYNILQTNDSKFISFNKIDMAIVPIIGIDKTFRRIGFGKGMYDRFYASLRLKPLSIFISRILHYSSNNITNNYDITGDFIIAKKGIKYDIFNNRIRNAYLRRPCTLYNKKNLYLKTKYSPPKSKNQSHSDRKRG